MAARLVRMAAFLGAAAAEVANATTTVAPSTAPSVRGGHSPGVGPGSVGAATALPPDSSSSSSSSGLFGLGLPALRRAFFVFLAIAALALVYYLGGRVFRTKKPARKKYGLLSNSEDNMEMASLESDEDTLFETRNLRR